MLWEEVGDWGVRGVMRWRRWRCLRRLVGRLESVVRKGSFVGGIFALGVLGMGNDTMMVSYGMRNDSRGFGPDLQIWELKRGMEGYEMV